MTTAALQALAAMPTPTPTLEHYLLTQAIHNAWANHRLLTTCCLLDDAAFAAPRTGFFPSLRATLNHTLTVDWYYVDAMERALQGLAPATDGLRFFTPEVPFARSTDVLREQRAVDERLIAICRHLTISSTGTADPGVNLLVQVPRRSGPVAEPFWRLLAHLFQHQIHHRGQAHAMLSGTAVAPPQLDEFFCVQDAPLRARELAALGFDEVELWRDRHDGHAG